MKTYDKIILDNGHGKDTAGKRSPDGSFYEYEFNRAIVANVLQLASENLMADRFTNLVPELHDIPLGTDRWTADCRIKRINDLVKANPTEKYLVLSMHANAAGMGDAWKNAKGFGIFYDKRFQGIADTAKLFVNELEKATKDEAITDKYVPKWGSTGVIETSGQYSIIFFPKCDSLLLELGFMDNKDEVEYLKSDAGRLELSLGIFTACQKVLADIG